MFNFVRSSKTILCAMSFAVLLIPSMARATLGESSASIPADAADMRATPGVNTAHPPAGVPTQLAPASGLFRIDQFTTPAGTVVSEYSGRDGNVFAVTWRGPKPPDVSTLLGRFYSRYRSAADTGAPSPFGLHASSVAAGDVTVETMGHMGLMWGRAYLRSAVPAGVNISEIK
jgi:hypothetical protein